MRSISRDLRTNFYPRSPCGERHNIPPDSVLIIDISIHALLAESDLENPARAFLISYFYPRSPCGERPIKGKPASPVIGISIHALLAESDLRACRVSSPRPYFYPRSPCGERPERKCSNMPLGIFLSTLSLRRATIPAQTWPLIHY